MANFITKAQYEELGQVASIADIEEFNLLLDRYAGIESVPYTAYSYFDSDGNYIGDSNESELDDLLQAAYVEVRDEPEPSNL